VTAAAGEGAGDRDPDNTVKQRGGDPEDSPQSTQPAKAEEDMPEEPLKGNTPRTCRKGARSGLQTQEEDNLAGRQVEEIGKTGGEGV
jgi:hypothetical protein